MRPSKFIVRRVLLALFIYACVRAIWELATSAGLAPERYLAGLFLQMLSPEVIQFSAIALITGVAWATADYYVYRRRAPAVPIELVAVADLAKRWFGWKFTEGEFMDFMAGLRQAHQEKAFTIQGRPGCVGDMV